MEYKLKVLNLYKFEQNKTSRQRIEPTQVNNGNNRSKNTIALKGN